MTDTHDLTGGALPGTRVGRHKSAPIGARLPRANRRLASQRQDKGVAAGFPDGLLHQGQSVFAVVDQEDDGVARGPFAEKVAEPVVPGAIGEEYLNAQSVAVEVVQKVRGG